MEKEKEKENENAEDNGKPGNVRVSI